MLSKKNSVCVLLLVYVSITSHNAQEINSTSGNQGAAQNSVDPRFFDRGPRGMGYPNSQDPRRYGNPPNNYPGNYIPYGNQNNNMQQPQQNFGWNPNSQNSNPLFYQGGPYQNQNNYPGNTGNFPFQQSPNNYGTNNYDGMVYPAFNEINQNPNYQRPYQNTPGNSNMYPGDVNGPYNNGHMPLNQGPYLNQPRPNNPGQSIQYPSQNGRYPSQENFQNNPNVTPGFLFPDDLNNFPNMGPQVPGNNLPYQNQFNHNSPQEQNYFNGQNNNHPYYQSNIPSNNVQYPMNNINNNFDNENIQFPNQPLTYQGQGSNLPDSNQVLPGNFNGSPQTRPQLPNNQPIDPINGPNANDTASVLGDPMFALSSTSSPGQVMFDGSTERPQQTQCEQTCPSTGEYDPVCGTNNITYSNTGKFYCARNCGVDVNILQRGRCDGDIQIN